MELRQKYVAHVQRMFELAGEKPETAKAWAQTVMRIETALAKGSLDRVSRRDPEKVYHLMKKDDMALLSPAFQWSRYFSGTRAPAFQSVNVAWPDFFKAASVLVQGTPLDQWKVYLTWHVLHSEATMLPTAFLKENFDFYGKTLTGATEMRPRWKRCVDFTDHQLGEALGKKFVDKTFGAEGKERTLKMVHALEKALGEDIEQAALDDARHQEGSAGQAQGHHQQDRLPGQVARLFAAWKSSATMPSATASAPTSSSSSASWTRSASPSTGWNGA